MPEQKELIEEVEELLADEPPWTVETHDARGDYVRICLVRRGPQFLNGYYVIAADDMEMRRDQAVTDYKDIVRGRELLRRLVAEVRQLREEVPPLRERERKQLGTVIEIRGCDKCDLCEDHQ